MTALQQQPVQHQGKQQVKKRQANIELLRILAMMMVVMLHFLSKGEVLPPLTAPMETRGYAAWILETLSIVAVNVYMLISGYFLVESRFKCRRLIQLVLQVLFYSLLVPICLMALGILTPQELTIYQLLQYIFPVQMLQYWFATAYVLMYLFSPLLGTAVHYMSKKQLQRTVILLLLVLSVSKSVLPVQLSLDNLGYDAIWFLCVYLVAAYIRLYGIPFFRSGKFSAAMYGLGCVGILGITLLVRMIYMRYGILDYFINGAYGYNHIFNLFAAVALFYAFLHLKLPEGKLSRWICRIAPYTFGVYLLHEQVEVRWLWPQWLGAGRVQSTPLFVLHACGCVLVVFVVGIVVDMCRGALFAVVGKLLSKGKIGRLLAWLDDDENDCTM